MAPKSGLLDSAENTGIFWHSFPSVSLIYSSGHQKTIEMPPVSPALCWGHRGDQAAPALLSWGSHTTGETHASPGNDNPVGGHQRTDRTPKLTLKGSRGEWGRAFQAEGTNSLCKDPRARENVMAAVVAQTSFLGTWCGVSGERGGWKGRLVGTHHSGLCPENTREPQMGFEQGRGLIIFGL